jgi:transcriptional regulator with XRE-family HTH domain
MKDNAKDAGDPFLFRLGEKVRTMRSRRGMSRKVLARHSDVSERYLAQLEADRTATLILVTDLYSLLARLPGRARTARSTS